MTKDHRCVVDPLDRTAAGCLRQSLAMMASTYLLQSGHCAGPALSPSKHLQKQRKGFSWTMRHFSYSYRTCRLPFGAFNARYNRIGSLFRGFKPPSCLRSMTWGKACWSLVVWIKLLPEVNDLQGLIIR